MSEPDAVGDAAESSSVAGGAVALWFRWKFPVVLLAALLLAVGQPLSLGLLADQKTFDVLCSLLILAVMLLVIEDRSVRWMALPLGILALLALWASHLCSETYARWLLISAHLLAAGFMAFALFGIVTAMFRWNVNQHPVLGAICGYLLLGIIWTLLYTAVEMASPGSFRMSAADAVDVTVPRSVRSILGYFSFITLATVGYGDVTPATPLARTLAWLEAVVGQFYLGVLVAGLVGIKVTQALSRRTAEPGN